MKIASVGLKMAGNRRSGRHLLKNVGTVSEEQDGKKPEGTKSGKKKLLKVLVIIAAAIIVLAAAGFAYLKFGIKPPEVNRERPRRTRTPYTEDQNPTTEPTSPSDNKKEDPGIVEEFEDNKWTFLIMATDDGNGNTDTIMVVTFDSTEYTLEVVNIPRDTLVNVSWNLKKVNSILANMKAKYRKEDDAEKKTMDAVVDAFADILGYEVDRWMLVDIKAFVKLVDSVNGVDYNIPVNMNYDDPAQNLHIHFSKGPKHLDGKQALEVVRFRSYASADIGRIGTQQDFLTSAVQQILAKKSSLNIIQLAGIFNEYVKTDMSLNDVIWFGREFLKMDAENINFDVVPADYWDTVYAGDSYPTIYVDEWLEIVNSRLSPWTKEITSSDVSILTRGVNKKLYVTDGNIKGNASWGGGISGTGTSRSGNNNNSGSGNNSSNSSGSNSSSNNGSSSSNSSSKNNSSGQAASSSSPPTSSQPPPSSSPGNKTTDEQSGLTEGESELTNDDAESTGENAESTGDADESTGENTEPPEILPSNVEGGNAPEDDMSVRQEPIESIPLAEASAEAPGSVVEN
ncbi:MAG: LCP family protein [Oscillospiraceae bacterium]|nr:LCP family protein [Oscillospiraceae bacterium]